MMKEEQILCLTDQGKTKKAEVNGTPSLASYSGVYSDETRRFKGHAVCSYSLARRYPG